MKKTFLPVLFWLYTSVLYGQFYAPDTAYHDRTQRVFPVEAARVLAWRQNASGAGIAEITYKLESTKAGASAWHIQWLDGNRKVLREKDVRYPESLLLEGPKYFREVFRQLADVDWLPRAAGRAGIDGAYWEGANRAGVARTEAAVANELAAKSPKMDTAGDAARLAGVLVHGAVPSLGNCMTLDSRLLARGAAWLCLAESIAGVTDDAAWAPLLFLSGRENAFTALWKSSTKAEPASRGMRGRLWDLLAAKPAVKEFFLFAAEKENREVAIPAMIYPAQFDLEWMYLLGMVADEVVGPEMAKRFCDYGPNVTMRGHEVGGKWGARMPPIAMRNWFATLSAFQPTSRDFTGYQPLLKKALAAKQALEGDEAAMIPVLAPLLNLGLDEGEGSLIPVAVVTARDLLGYGWETAGLQFGYTHKYQWGYADDELGAERLVKAVRENLKGVEVFFEANGRASLAPLPDLRRLQMVISSRVEWAMAANPPAGWRDDPFTHASRIWLGRGGNAAMEAAIRLNAPIEDLGKLVERMRTEGGPRSICYLVNFGWDVSFPKVVDQLNLRPDLVKELPWDLDARSYLARENNKRDAFKRAQEMESLGWEYLSCAESYRIIYEYTWAHAFDAARRYYDQAVPFVHDMQAFCIGALPMRYGIAWLDKDEKKETELIQQCTASGHNGYRMLIIHTLLHNDLPGASRALDMAIKVLYRDRREYQELKDWLPQFAAFLDVNNAGHQRAIDSFPDGDWMFLRWALAKQAGFSDVEVSRVFHDATDGLDGVMVAATKSDRKLFGALRAKVSPQGIDAILVQSEFERIAKSKPRPDQPDLKPPAVRPIADLVREKLRLQAR